MEELQNKEQLNNGVCLVEVYSSTCSNCKKQAKIIEGIAIKFPDVKFYGCLSEEDLGTGLCEEHNLMQAPSILIYKNGMLITKHGGLAIPSKLEGLLTEATN